MCLALLVKTKPFLHQMGGTLTTFWWHEERGKEDKDQLWKTTWKVTWKKQCHLMCTIGAWNGQGQQ
jgi:hypothetical protein